MSTLFLRVATYLASENLADTFLVDYADGFMAKHRDPELVGFLEYSEEAVAEIPGSAIAVFQSMTPWSIFPLLKLNKSTKVFFWNCYPFNLIPLLPGLRTAMQNNPMFGKLVLNSVLFPYKSKVRRFVDLLTDCNALVFMDSENSRVTSDYLGQLSSVESYLPIPIESPEPDAAGATTRHIDDEEVIRIAWIGRVADFKHHILALTIERLNEFQPEIGKKVLFYVVGSGSYLPRIKEASSRLANISFEFIDHVSPAELDTFLQRNVDLVFAMGSSALQAGRLGIPVILLDFSYRKVSSNYQYSWLYKRRGFSLGESISKRHLDGGDDSILVRMREYLADPAIQSRRTLEYIEINHMLPAVSKKLVELLRESSCTWGMLIDSELLEKGIAYQALTKIRTMFSS